MNRALFSSENQKWETPADFVAEMKQVYPVDLDLAASRPNVCQRYYSEENSAFDNDNPWDGYHMWLNRPYGRGPTVNAFSKRIEEEVQNLRSRSLLILVPNRSDSSWWREHTAGDPLFVAVKGRLKFGSQSYWVEYWTDLRMKMARVLEKYQFYSMDKVDAEVLTKEELKLYKKIPKNGSCPPQPAPFPSALIYHGYRYSDLIDWFRHISEDQVWVKL